MPLGLQGRQREHDIGSADFAAVVKGDARPQPEPVDQSIGGDGQLVGREQIDRIGLVKRARHQRGKGDAHAVGGIALDDIGVERIEGGAARADQLREQSALGRIDIDVIEILKIRRVFQVAEGR